MRKLSLLLIFLMFSACSASIAKVNGEKIPLADYMAQLKVAASQSDVAWLTQPERAKVFKDRLLEAIINETLLLQEATRLKITTTGDELDEDYARYKSQYTDATFKEMVKARDISYDDWKAERRRSYIIDKLREIVAPDAKKISDAELKAFYDQNISEFKKPEMVRVRQILVNKESTAKMIHDKLVTGDNFAALAQQYSISPDAKNGGDVGFFARGSFPAIFDKICFALPVGGVSDVVKTDYGYQIFKVTDHNPARTVPFAEAKKMILHSIRQAGGQKLFEQLLAKLRQDAKIKIDTKKLDKIEVPHDAAAQTTDTH